MDLKFARAVAALNTAAILAKDPETKGSAVEFIKQNPSYFPNGSNIVGESKNSSVPKFVPLNPKNKKA